MTKKQAKIAKRNEALGQMIPGAISCDYIASVNRKLPNGAKILTVNINYGGHAYRMMDSTGKIHTTSNCVEVQGVRTHYIKL